QYVAKNTTNYLLFTNYLDALPLDDDDRRYLILKSQWQSRVQLEGFKADNPKYYDDLYEALELSPGGLRGWLLNHNISKDFSPTGAAPRTAGRAELIHN